MVEDRFRSQYPSSPAAITRRRLLRAGALAGSAAVAGCIGDSESDDPSDMDDVHVEGQTLRLPMFSNPEEITFNWWYYDHVIESELTSDFEVRRVVQEPGMFGRWFNNLYFANPGPKHYQLYENLEVTSDTLEITIREDAYWSDGEPVTAIDAYGNYAKRMYVPGVGWEPDPAEITPLRSVYEGEMPDGPDGKTLIWHVHDHDPWPELGGFDAFPKGYFYYELAHPAGRLGVDSHPYHQEPFTSIVDDAIEVFEEKPDPRSARPPTGDDLFEEYVDEEDLWDFREGENVITHGLWTVDEIKGAQGVVLVPNEHHRHYDDLNYDEVVLEYNESDQRRTAAIASRNIDWAPLEVSPQAADGFPDFLEEITSPSGAGYSIGINHASAFGDLRVRRAMMYALHAPDASDNVHPTAAEPVITPGLDSWVSDAVLDQEWAEENFISYEQDLDRAAELMQEAGYERNADGVWEKDGEALEPTLATTSDTPIFESTVESQLNEFGIAVNVQSMDEATFNERREGSTSTEYIEEEYGGDGDFDLWANNWYDDSYAGYYNSLHRNPYLMKTHRARVRARNWYDHDVQEEILQEYADNNWIAGQTELWQDATIDLPPAGEPDGDREPFNPTYVGGITAFGPYTARDGFTHTEYYNPPHDERHGENEAYFHRKFAWLANWWLPSLPVVLQESQDFINRENWLWPDELGGEANEDVWEYFGLSFNPHYLPSMNRIAADPENPKGGAEVVDE